jgi:hypothetical protein
LTNLHETTNQIQTAIQLGYETNEVLMANNQELKKQG